MLIYFILFLKYIMKKNYHILFILIIIYLLLKYIIPYGEYWVYPINLLVTFLHELWHAIAALITWWEVKSIQVNPDGSGYAITSGGIISLILIGWYIGSAVFWNILLYIWFKKEHISQYILYFIAALLLFSGIIWFNSIVWSIILFLLAWILWSVSKKNIIVQ